MSQYPTPQFIEEEGRIISFLTFRQFFTLCGGGAVCIVLYLLLPTNLFIMAALMVGALTLAIAFVRVNNESIFRVFAHFWNFSMASKNYLWAKKELPFEATMPETQPAATPPAPSEATSPNPGMVIGKSRLQKTRKIMETKR